MTNVRELNSLLNKGGQWDAVSTVARRKSSRATVATTRRNAERVSGVAPVRHD